MVAFFAVLMNLVLILGVMAMLNATFTLPGVAGIVLTIGAAVVLDIIDNGKGFPKEGRQRLLEPYMTTRAEGTGLGLPIVTKILEDHGGGLDLLDAPDGQGACVRLHFPNREPLPDAAIPPHAATPVAVNETA